MFYTSSKATSSYLVDNFLQESNSHMKGQQKLQENFTLNWKILRDHYAKIDEHVGAATSCLACAIAVSACCAQLSSTALHHCGCCHSTLAWVCGAHTTSHI